MKTIARAMLATLVLVTTSNSYMPSADTELVTQIRRCHVDRTGNRMSGCNDETRRRPGDGDGDTALENTTSGPPPPPDCIDTAPVVIGPSMLPGMPQIGIDPLMTGIGLMGSFLDPPEDDDEYIVRVMCRDPSIPCETVDECVYNIPQPFFQWRNPGDGNEWTEADLVATVVAQLGEALPDPVVRTNPDNDRASIVNVPTFFWVENWTGTVEEQACAPNDPTFCIDATAEPRLVLHPGEPDTEPIECQGAGVPFDPDSEMDAAQQAQAPDACTYTYQLRTGVEDRPRAWTAQVEVIWDITWNPADAVGTPQIELTTDVPRQVNEIQAVVTD